MTMQAGLWVRLVIVKEVAPYGFYLTNGKQEVLLPYGEIENQIAVNQSVDVFLYHDTLDRLVATMRKPKVVWGQLALLQIVDVHPRFGYFLDMGLSRQVLLPYKFVSEDKELRPCVGDFIYIYLDHDRQGRLIAKIARDEQLITSCVRAPSDWNNRQVEAIVYKSLHIGTFVICDAGVLGFGVIGFIDADERTRLTRLGERLNLRVTFVREDGRVNVSMRPLKENSLAEDAQHILDVLQQRPGLAMPYSDLSPPDVIKKKFGMTKSAFKRALGKLMKERRIIQKENWTYLEQESPTHQEPTLEVNDV